MSKKKRVNQDRIQKEGYQAWCNNDGWGTLAMATGSGKSRIAIIGVQDCFKMIKNPVILIVVPTEKLRDENWKNEFTDWGVQKYWPLVQRSCYASIKNLKNNHYDYVIFDESHNLTEANSIFFKDNTIDTAIGLTATPPVEEEKKKLIDKLLPVIFEYELDQAVLDGVVSPYEIIVIETYLDNSDKYIQAGSKDKPFMTTEEAHYQYLSKRVRQAQATRNANFIKVATMARMRFLYNLKSKYDLCARLLNKVYPKQGRTLVFAGSIERAEFLCGTNVYHSQTDDKALVAFVKKLIDILGAVKALNEGHNLPMVDQMLVGTVNSNPKNLIQQIGRGIRFRVGHKCLVYIPVVVNTQDQTWLEKALAVFDPACIRYDSARNY